MSQAGWMNIRFGGYYPDFGAGAEHVRFRAHRDFDLATLLLGAGKPGLEIASRDGIWWPVAPTPDGIVLNAGHVLAVESGGRIPSTPHRVVTPERPAAVASRWSTS